MNRTPDLQVRSLTDVLTPPCSPHHSPESADEPTGNLDHTGDEILRLLRRAVDDYGLAIVMVTHSYLAAAAMDRVIFIQDGTIVDEVDAASVTPPPGVSRHLHVVPPRPGGR